MGLRLRRLNKSSEDISDHICLVLFLAYLCTSGPEDENKDYLKHYISDFFVILFSLLLSILLFSFSYIPNKYK